jgi:DNA integrity scanning protein DisA with diadenylate cyclase activity
VEAIRLIINANDLFINKYILFNTSQSVSGQSEDTKDRKLYNYLKDLYREFGLRTQFVISDVRIETRGFNLEEEIQKVQNKIQEKEEKKREYGKKRERIKSLSKTIVETFNK